MRMIDYKAYKFFRSIPAHSLTFFNVFFLCIWSTLPSMWWDCCCSHHWLFRWLRWFMSNNLEKKRISKLFTVNVNLIVTRRFFFKLVTYVVEFRHIIRPERWKSKHILTGKIVTKEIRFRMREIKKKKSIVLIKNNHCKKDVGKFYMIHFLQKHLFLFTNILSADMKKLWNVRNQ